MRKKVLLLSNTSFSIRKFRKELILSLIEEGYEVILSLPESNPELERELGVKNVVIPYARRSKNVLNDIKLIFQFYSLFKEINTDIILSFTIKPNIYGSFASNLSGHKQICTITGTGQSFLKKNWLYYGVMNLYKLAFSSHQTVVFQNENDRDFFYQNKMIKGNSIVLSGSGVNLESFVYKEYPSDNPLRFVFVG
ncbi:MAG: glycosyltransferase, partial [Erysipelotrichaceae bacterium]